MNLKRHPHATSLRQKTSRPASASGALYGYTRLAHLLGRTAGQERRPRACGNAAITPASGEGVSVAPVTMAVSSQMVAVTDSPMSVLWLMSTSERRARDFSARPHMRAVRRGPGRTGMPRTARVSAHDLQASNEAPVAPNCLLKHHGRCSRSAAALQAAGLARVGTRRRGGRRGGGGGGEARGRRARPAVMVWNSTGTIDKLFVFFCCAGELAGVSSTLAL